MPLQPRNSVKQETVDTAGELAFATLLVAAGAETLELEVAGKAAYPPKISAPVAG